LLVIFGNVVNRGFLGDFLDQISWGSFVVISPALQKFPAKEKKKNSKKVSGQGTGEKKKKKKEEEQKLIYVFLLFFKKNVVLATCVSST
jgi:hypothetical protein